MLAWVSVSVILGKSLMSIRINLKSIRGKQTKQRFLGVALKMNGQKIIIISAEHHEWAF